MSANYHTDRESFIKVRQQYAALTAARSLMDQEGEAGLVAAIDQRIAVIDADSYTLRLACIVCGQPVDVTCTVNDGTPAAVVCVNCNQETTAEVLKASRHNFRDDGTPCYHIRCGGPNRDEDVHGYQCSMCGHYMSRGQVRYLPESGDYVCKTWHGCDSLEADRQRGLTR